jgi:fructosamine-3-kinase
LLDTELTQAERVHGGDINDAYVLTLPGGQQRFMKTHASPPRGMFQAEARGLGWLSVDEALRLPAVIAVADIDAPEQFLVLEHIASSSKSPDHDERLGRGLAALHRASPGTFGLDHDNFIATLAQTNRPADHWASFYASQRLEPMLRLAVDAGHATSGLRRAVGDVIARINLLTGPTEPPARLHGDLWGGNAIVDELGHPCLIDPAVYAGHREVDLAMMRLFGGFAARVFDAYTEAFPLAVGHQRRVPLYQLYPLLVHVNLFGRAYVTRAEQAAIHSLSSAD